MDKGRLEAFSDGVMAILITIMVLSLRTPHSADIEAIFELWPTFLSYMLSFFYLAIYWNNHHHLFQIVKHVNGSILWANMHLLFWFSLLPFVTAWSGENQFADFPVALYGVVLLFSAIAYYILTRVLVNSHGSDSTLAKALGQDVKEKFSILFYAIGIVVSFYSASVGFCVYWLVAIMWIIPDRRIEKNVK